MNSQMYLHFAMIGGLFASLTAITVVACLYLFDNLPVKYKPGGKQAKSIAYTMFTLSLVTFVVAASRDLSDPMWLFAFTVSLILFITMSVILCVVLSGAQLPLLSSLPIGTWTVYLTALAAILAIIVTLYKSFFQI